MIIRELRSDESKLLKDYLYEAIFIPEGMEPPDKSILEQPGLALYYTDFGTGKADLCLAAEDNGKVIGAVWTRIINDYGHVDEETPSLAIAVDKEYRGQGTGKKLMYAILDRLKEQGFSAVSLSVQKANQAVRFYQSLGFTILKENDEEYIMIRKLQDIS
ncbi:MAG: GNAT family N-acetyltransferase [Solobacterium sp.]|nr:GNAT family N-acetyltransferase [Solobacterium sp.]